MKFKFPCTRMKIFIKIFYSFSHNYFHHHRIALYCIVCKCFMHEYIVTWKLYEWNSIFLHKIKMFMHENEDSAPYCHGWKFHAWDCVQLNFLGKILEPENHPSGNIFMHGNSIFMHENVIFMHENVIFHFMPRFLHAWNFSNGGSQRAVVAKLLGYVPVAGGQRLPDIDRLTAVLPRVDDVPCRTTTIANSLVSPRVYFGRTAKWIINRSSSITATMAICKPTSSGKSVVLCLSGARKVLCIKKKTSMHVTFISMHEYIIYMHESCIIIHENNVFVHEILFPYMKMISLPNDFCAWNSHPWKLFGSKF